MQIYGLGLLFNVGKMIDYNILVVFIILNLNWTIRNMANKTLTIVAKILAKAEHRELVKRELIKLIDTTKAEAGCINYDLHQDQDNENLFLFYENWTSRALWQQHMNNAHLAEYVKATEGAIEDFTLHEMTIIG